MEHAGRSARHFEPRLQGDEGPCSRSLPAYQRLLDDNAIIIDLELPGKTVKDIDLTLEAQAVVVADKPAEGNPAWSRRIDLPFRVDADKANAKFTNGILRIELPKADAPGVRHIAIEG